MDGSSQWCTPATGYPNTSGPTAPPRARPPIVWSTSESGLQNSGTSTTRLDCMGIVKSPVQFSRSSWSPSSTSLEVLAMKWGTICASDMSDNRCSSTSSRPVCAARIGSRALATRAKAADTRSSQSRGLRMASRQYGASGLRI